VNIIDLIKLHEGKRLFPYNDSTGKRIFLKNGNITIGYGRNLQSNGISESEAETMLTNDVNSIIEELSFRLPLFNKLNETRQACLVDMAYNMGIKNLLKFSGTLNIMASRNWGALDEHLKRTLWYKQHKKWGSKRADRIIHYLVSGEGLEMPKPVIKKKAGKVMDKVIEKTDGKKTKTGILSVLLGILLNLVRTIFPETQAIIPEGAGDIVMQGGGILTAIGIVDKVNKHRIAKGVKQ
jgi:lysozyme